MSVLDFKAYKDKGELKYLDDKYPEVEDQRFEDELDAMAEVMEMSTDELLGELTIRVNSESGKGIRETSTSNLVDELTQRLLAIEYILFLVMAKNTKN